ncbi:MAG: hypothetical protein ACLP2X_12970 [Syntrophobacteraceae bacterium]
MNSLKAKLALLFLVIAIVTAIPAELRADGNPFPLCNGQVCMPPG